MSGVLSERNRHQKQTCCLTCSGTVSIHLKVERMKAGGATQINRHQSNQPALPHSSNVAGFSESTVTGAVCQRAYVVVQQKKNGGLKTRLLRSKTNQFFGNHFNVVRLFHCNQLFVGNISDNRHTAQRHSRSAPSFKLEPGTNSKIKPLPKVPNATTTQKKCHGGAHKTITMDANREASDRSQQPPVFSTTPTRADDR